MFFDRKNLTIVLMTFLWVFLCPAARAQLAILKKNFVSPPPSYGPGVYWYFMDGNMTAESIKKDLQAMKSAGISNVIFLEVNVGVPRGSVDFLSDKWFSLTKMAMEEAKTLGIAVTLGIGPGWTGSGGPWVNAAQSMQLLVSSETIVSPDSRTIILPVPYPPKSFFGEDGLPDGFKIARKAYFQDVAVLAIPERSKNTRISDYPEKALFYRAPYSSGIVRPFIQPSTSASANDSGISKNDVLDLTDKMKSDGTLNWHPHDGRWLVMRFVSRNNGAITRPAPVPGLGFESDKFDTSAIKAHLDAYVGKILKLAPPDRQSAGGLKTLHMDSWEMSSQNWSQQFRQEFIKRRGYDPLKFFPAYYGYVIASAKITERFLWDMRQTTQDLIFQNHAGYVKKYAHANGMKLSIEPYDMNPTSDLDLGSIADVPMAEFWTKGFGFNSTYSVIESTSIGHVMGRSVIQSESFTAQDGGWKQYPGSMKNQGDWALAAGLNKFFFHTFENQFLPDSLKPGATMGPFGVHWDRSETWWPFVGAYHDYLRRCQYMLQQGRAVADILYLTPEGCPNVFVPPMSALTGDTIGDRRGFNFDGCTARQLLQAKVHGREITFPGGASYRILVLPALPTMTPELIKKVGELVKSGAMVIGPRPVSSPSLTDYPKCDVVINTLGNSIWGDSHSGSVMTYRNYGKGMVISGGESNKLDGKLYPYYQTVASILKKHGLVEDFDANDSVRYTHRTNRDWDVYFIANKKNKPISFNAFFRSVKGSPEVWNAIDGTQTRIRHFTTFANSTAIPLRLDAYESCFIVFSKDFRWLPTKGQTHVDTRTVLDVSKGWQVTFDPKWGGPAHVDFKTLIDWSTAADDGIKYYSGTASYSKSFRFKKMRGKESEKIYLELGRVNNMARLTLNRKVIGTLWTAPWRLDITKVLIDGDNELKIEVANSWSNRLIGDQRLPDDGPKEGNWPEWLLKGKSRTSKRYTFTTTNQYSAQSPLEPSGLMGPVKIIAKHISNP